MKKITILHVCGINNDKFNGVSVVVPEHFRYQSEIATVGLLNCTSIEIEKLSDCNNVFMYSDYKKIEKLPEPFNKPDVVVFHEVYKPQYLFLYRYLIKNKIPYIVVPHGCLTKGAQNTKKIKKKICNFLVFDKFLKNAKAIQYLSQKEYEMSLIKNKNHYILGNGSSDIPENNLYKIRKRKNKGFNFVYVGRYDYLIKGLDQLLEACSLIKKEMLKNNIKINLYGFGDEESVRKISDHIRNANLSKVVKLNGAVYGEEKRKFILKNDVFIQVSRTEGQPLGIIEAMTLGMPILVSEGTGFKDIVDKYKVGMCTKCISTKIGKTILKIYKENKKLNKFSENSFNYASKQYSWPIIVKKNVRIYYAIIKGKESWM